MFAYTWDPENRLLEAAVGTQQVFTYAYSADGKRQQLQKANALTFFVWDGENVLQEANASLVTTLAYVQSPGVWGGLVRQYEAQGMQYFGYDFTGSTRLVVRPDGTVANAYDYKAFGEELQSGTSATVYRYGGLWGYNRDDVTVADRLYVGARYLRVDLGRWISEDPIGFYGKEWNLYRYGKNNPANVVDPTGMLD